VCGCSILLLLFQLIHFFGGSSKRTAQLRHELQQRWSSNITKKAFQNKGIADGTAVDADCSAPLTCSSSASLARI
jgi:hypothetical protein